MFLNAGRLPGYIYLEPVCPLLLVMIPPNKVFSNQNKGHLGSRYIYIYREGC